MTEQAPLQVAQDEKELGLIAQGKSRWVERWYGSEPMKGSAIVTENRDEVAVLGGDKETHRAVCKIVMAHNAAIQAFATDRQADQQVFRDIVERLATCFYPTIDEAIEAAQIALGDAQ